MRCPNCEGEVPEGADVCPRCARPLASAGSASPDPSTAPAPPGDLERSLGQLKQWHDASEALGVAVPTVPRWVEARARREPSEGWTDVLRRLEESASGTIASALAGWERTMTGRLDHLEAYHIDVQLERVQIHDALDALGKGEAAPMLASLRQVERLVSLKERHLGQAQEEIGRLVELLGDMRSLGLSPPHDPSRIAEELDSELKNGRLAPLKERLRSLRAEATHLLAERVPAYVTWYGTFLARERANGVAVDREVEELARSARALQRGHAEEGLHRLRALTESHPVPGGPGASVPTP